MTTTQLQLFYTSQHMETRTHVSSLARMKCVMWHVSSPLPFPDNLVSPWPGSWKFRFDLANLANKARSLVLIDFVLLEALPYWMFSLFSVNVVYIALSAAKLVFFGHGIDNIVTLASAVHSHLARIRRQNRQRPQPCTWRLDNTCHCLSCISVSVIGAFSQLVLDTNSGSIKGISHR